MISKFDIQLAKIHDARLYGLLLDIEPKSFALNVIIYAHLFSDFESGKYSLEKALITLENASIEKFIIINDLSGGQFYITDCSLNDLGNGKFRFVFSFNISSLELVIIAENLKLTTSEVVQEAGDQFLPTNWINLFK